MKKFFKNIAFILLGSLIIFGCEESPTELIQPPDYEEVVLEVPPFTIPDYDSLGIVNENVNADGIIKIAGVKNSYKGTERNFSYASAIIFDRDDPIRTPSGRAIGFRGLPFHVIGKIFFNGDSARTSIRRINFREGGRIVDTVAGFQYLLVNVNNSLGELNFSYNSLMDVSFRFNQGFQKSFELPTQPEIFARAGVETRKNTGEREIVLNWEISGNEEPLIILGGREKISQKITPLFRVKDKNRKEIKIPFRALKGIDLSRFDRLVFTFFIGKEDEVVLNQGITFNKIFVVSQSLNNVWIDIPE